MDEYGIPNMNMFDYSGHVMWTRRISGAIGMGRGWVRFDVELAM